LALKRRDGKDQESKTNKVVHQAGGLASGINNLPPPPPVVNLTIDPLTGEAVPMLPDPKEIDEYYIKRLSVEEQKKNKDEMLAREEDLIYLSPMLVGYALKNKLWCKSRKESLRMAD
jgi:hypothetical protein